jgi:tetratricopeptide (TPR) repeat protein
LSRHKASEFEYRLRAVRREDFTDMTKVDLDDAYREANQLKLAGRNQEAIEKLLDILKQDPNFIVAHLGLAVCYGRIGDHLSAVKHGETAVQLDPNDPFGYTALSVTYLRAFDGTQDRKYITLAEDAKARGQMLTGHVHE